MLLLTTAAAQGSRPLSLRDAQRWQQLQGQADDLLAKGDYAQAEAAGREAVAAGTAGFGAGDANVAASHSTLGAAQLKASNFAAAEASFRQALAIYEKQLGAEHEFVGAMLNNLGLVVERRSDFAGAELLLRRALAIKEKAQGRSHPDTAVTLANLARVLDRQGRSGQLAAQRAPSATSASGPAPAAQSGATPAAVPAPAATAPAVDPSSAEALHRSALAVHEKELGPDHPTTLATLVNLGNALLLQRRFPEAEQVFRRVLAAREKGLPPNHPDIAASLNSVANTLFEQNKEDDVNLAPGRRLRGGPRVAASASETESLYRRALEIQEKAPAGPALAATLNNLAVLLAGRGRFDEAEPLHKRALDIAERTLGPAHLDTASMQTTLAITYDRQGRSAEAEALYSRAVAGARESGVARNVLINASSMGFSLARRGRLRDALPYYRESVDALDTLYAQSRGLSEEARQAFLGQFGYVYRELIRICMVLHPQSPGAGLDREALAVASRSQSRVFSEMLRQADVARFSASPEFARVRLEREALQQDIATLRLGLLSVADSQPGAAAQKAGYSGRLVAATSGLKAVEDLLWRDYPRYMELTDPRPVSVDDLQKRLLKPGEALLSFALLRNEALIFAITRDSFRMVVARVGRDEIARRVALVRRPMERVAQGDPLVVLRQIDPALLHSLYRDLVEPVAPVLAGASQVIVVADGPLYSLPLEMLVTSYGAAERTGFEAARAASNGSAEKPFLAEYAQLPFARKSHRFVYLPSLAALASQRLSPKAGSAPQRQLVAFADPVFGPEGDNTAAGYGPTTRQLLGALASAGPGGAPRIARLAETEQEAREAAALLGEPSMVLTRRDAQEKRAKSGVLKDARYVLFATHGFLGTDFLQNLDVVADADGALSRGAGRGALAQPALALTLTGDLEGEDGLLSMKEVIEDLELSADLVVLSACNTVGDAQSGNNGEGFAGLTRAFMYAGAKRLMVSHWSVENQSTQALVTGSFRSLKDGAGAVEALAHSQAALFDTTFATAGRSYARAHPFFWAPFVVVGD